MDRWIKALQKKVREIADCTYQPDPLTFANAPEDIVKISNDLDALANALAERERIQQALTHEIHHRVKNNLQIVTSLLKLQARNIKDPISRQPLEQAQIRMGALALIHRLLYEQGDDSSTGKISIERLFSGLCSQLRNAFLKQDQINFSTCVTGTTLHLDSAVPLTLLAVEAVTNAYGHAFPDGRPGSIELEFHVREGQGVLRICDDGIGYDAQSDFQSMGRQLMKAFAHQLGGMLSIESATTTGTVVTLRYPVRI